MITATATYNANDWLTSQSDGPGPGMGAGTLPFTTTYGYDVMGRLRLHSLLGGSSAGVVYAALDAAGRTTALTDVITDTGHLPTTSTSSFGYMPDDLPLTDTLPSSAGAVQTTRQYDADNRLTCIQDQGPYVAPALSLAQSFQYSYSPLGVTTAISTYNATTCGLAQRASVQALGYDALGRLTQASGTTWTYDGNGNLTAITRQPGAIGPVPLLRPRPQTLLPASPAAPAPRVVGVSGVTPQPRVIGAQPYSLTYSYRNPDGSEPAGWLPNELVATHDFSASGPLYSAYMYDASGNTSSAVITPSGTQGAITRTLSYNGLERLSSVASSDGVSLILGYNAQGLRAVVAWSCPD